VAHKTGALETRDLEWVVVDSTVQPKAIAHPTDARLMHRAIEKLVALAKAVSTGPGIHPYHWMSARQCPYYAASDQCQSHKTSTNAHLLRPLTLKELRHCGHRSPSRGGDAKVKRRSYLRLEPDFSRFQNHPDVESRLTLPR